MNTKETFDQIVWYYQVEYFNQNDLFDGDLVDVVKRMSNRKRFSTDARKRLSESAARITRNLKQERTPRSFMTQVRQFIGAALIEASTYRYGQGAPKVHHWIPVCYLSNFTRGLEQKKSRGAYIPAVNFTEEGNELLIVSDKEFAHSPDGKKGFFELSAERFFAVIESRYCNALMRLTPGQEPTRFHMVSYVSMLLVQHLRAPMEAEERFKLRSIAEFAKALEELLDTVEEGYAYIETSEEAFPFAPYAPTRARKFVDGARAWHFPLTSNVTLIFSERELTEAERARMAEGSRISTVKDARRRKQPLYGALETDF